MRKGLLALGATAIAATLLAWVARSLDPRSGWFAFLVVWVPMAWLGTVSRCADGGGAGRGAAGTAALRTWSPRLSAQLLSRLARPRLPESYHRLRSVERTGRLYELLGVRLAKRLLRRGPLVAFNPGLHLPAERTPERLAQLDQRMRDAEASHVILFVAMLGVSANAAARSWWGAAAWTLLFNTLLNGYPVMLQRYNRALLSQRFDLPTDQPR